jgi:hypothetical protein
MTVLLLMKTTFVECGSGTAGSYGGAIWCGDFLTFSASDSTFQSCFAGTAGGALYFVTTVNSILFVRCRFLNNTVRHETERCVGSALYFNGGGLDVVIVTTTFVNCSTTGQATVYYDGLSNRSTGIRIEGGLFLKNFGRSDGGLFVSNTGFLNVRRTVFDLELRHWNRGWGH